MATCRGEPVAETNGRLPPSSTPLSVTYDDPGVFDERAQRDTHCRAWRGRGEAAAVRRKQLLADIDAAFAQWRTEVQSAGRQNRNDGSVLSEAVVMHVLNAMYGWNLVNANEDGQNYPAVDLLDLGSGVAVQVTSRRTSKKVQYTLDSIAKALAGESKAKPLLDGIERFCVFILSGKQGTYPSLSVPEGIDFDKDRDILDTDDILRVLTTSADLSLVEAVHGVVTEEFPQRNNVDRLSDTPSRPEELAREAFERADTLWDEGELLQASDEARRACDLAREAGVADLARAAMRRSIRAKIQHLLGSAQLPSTQAARLTAEIGSQIEDYAAFAGTPAFVDLERSILSFAMEDGEAALASARSAYESLPDDDSYRVDALVSWLQALQLLERESEALELRAEVDRWSAIDDQERVVALELEWLRAAIRASVSTDAHLRHFIELADEIAARGTGPTARLIHMLGELAAELDRASQLRACATVCLRAHNLSAGRGGSSHLLQSTSIALQAAEVLAAIDDLDACQDILRQAHQHMSALQSERNTTDHGAGGYSEWASLRARLLLVHGRCLTEMAFRGFTGENRISDPDTLVEEARVLLDDAQAHAHEHSALVRGNLTLFKAELAWWRGRIALAQGRPQEGARLLRDVRKPEALANDEFASRIAYRAWMAEAEAHFMSGDIAMFLEVAEGLLATQGEKLPSDLLEMAKSLIADVQKRIQPVVEWMGSRKAEALSRESASATVREVVATQAEYILRWYDAWTDKEKTPAAEWLDFWGRGGFARIAAAVRGRPHSVVCVDAASIDDIRHLARVLCPFFDTVLVKWKGTMHPGHVLVPVDIQACNEPGGHGYGATSSMIGEPPQWFVATTWGNLLPSAVAEFIFTEARDLFRDGRMVVLPACLVGCTQLGSGWTDDLLATGFLHGAVSVVRRQVGDSDGPATGMKRVLDLTKTTIPFVDGVGLCDMAAVLRDTDDALLPLRRVVFSAMASQDLRWERWSAIAALEAEIEEARRFTDAKLREFVSQHSSPWSVAGASQALVVASPDEDAPKSATEPMTSMLKALSPCRSSPWIPFLALEKVGGRLRWTSPLDNRSQPPTHELLAQLPKAGIPPLIHSWLYPGFRGWGAWRSLRVPLKFDDAG